MVFIPLYGAQREKRNEKKQNLGEDTQTPVWEQSSIWSYLCVGLVRIELVFDVPQILEV